MLWIIIWHIGSLGLSFLSFSSLPFLLGICPFDNQRNTWTLVKRKKYWTDYTSLNQASIQPPDIYHKLISRYPKNTQIHLTYKRNNSKSKFQKFMPRASDKKISKAIPKIWCFLSVVPKNGNLQSIKIIKKIKLWINSKHRHFVSCAYLCACVIIVLVCGCPYSMPTAFACP